MTSNDIVVWVNAERSLLYSLKDRGFGLAIDNSIKVEGGSEENHNAFHSQSQFHEYFHKIFYALEHADRILIVGPGSTKMHLIRHALKHNLSIDQKIVGIETAHGSSEAEILGLAKHYFS